MAKNKDQELKPLEELRRAQGTGAAVFAGACAMNGWRAGKLLSEEAYREGIRRFADSPAAKIKEV